jgi:hypothetical protein
MRNGILILGIAALGLASVASIEPASAINCGPGMNSDGYRCFPAWQRDEARGAYGYYRRGHGRRVVDCGPGMNSDGYRCFPIRERYRRW